MAINVATNFALNGDLPLLEGTVFETMVDALAYEFKKKDVPVTIGGQLYAWDGTEYVSMVDAAIEDAIGDLSPLIAKLRGEGYFQ